MNQAKTQLSKDKVSAIIPFLNEQKTILGVVKKLLKHPAIGEVICIDDGSTDESVQRLEDVKNEITLIRLKKNHGKGFALVQGIKKAKYEIVAFFDADLMGLTNHHIDLLLEPVQTGQARAVLGYKMPQEDDFIGKLAKNIGGERVYYKKDLFPHLTEMKTTRFGVEMFLNNLFPKDYVKKLPLIGLLHLLKYEKHKPQQAFRETLREVVEITQQIGKNEGLLSKDLDIIKDLSKLTDLTEVKKAMNMISNKDIKRRFKKVFAYISQFNK